MKGRFCGGWVYLKPLLDVFESVQPIYAGPLSGEINNSGEQGTEEQTIVGPAAGPGIA